MKIIFQPDRNYLKRIKRAHVIRAIIRRDAKTTSPAKRNGGSK